MTYQQERPPNCGEILGMLLAVVLAGGLIWGCHSSGQSRHRVDYYQFQVQEIVPSSRGYLARVVGDNTGFAIPLTVAQANSIKAGDIIDFTLEFNGWGTCQGTPYLKKQ